MVFSQDGKVYNFSYKRLKDLYEYSAAEGEKNYARMYAAWIKPLDYLFLTCPDVQDFIDRAKPLDYKRLCEERQEIYLRVDMETGQVVGHEGRHRMAALHKAGATMVAITVCPQDEKGKYNREFVERITVTGQKFTYLDSPCSAPGVVDLRCLVPISLGEKELFYNTFGPDVALSTFVGSSVYAVEDIQQFSTGAKVSERSRCIGVVKGFSDNPDYSKGVPHPATPFKISYVHLHNKSNPKGYQDYAIKIGDFLNRVQEGKYRLPSKDLASLDDLIDAARRGLGDGNKTAGKVFEREL